MFVKYNLILVKPRIKFSFWYVVSDSLETKMFWKCFENIREMRKKPKQNKKQLNAFENVDNKN